MRLYRAADVLLKHQAAIESRVFQRVQDLFELDATVTLYDLTNTSTKASRTATPRPGGAIRRKSGPIARW